MSRKRKLRRKSGDVVAIPIGNGNRVGFGLLLEEPLIAFFDLSSKAGEEPPVEEIIRAPVAFRVWVMNQPVVDGLWPVIGRVAIPQELLTPPWFFKQDPISGKITVGRTGSEELPPEPGQMETLERAAVWSASHIADRLQDHFAGRPSKWVQSMRPKRTNA